MRLLLDLNLSPTLCQVLSSSFVELIATTLARVACNLQRDELLISRFGLRGYELQRVGPEVLRRLGESPGMAIPQQVRERSHICDGERLARIAAQHFGRSQRIGRDD